METKRDQIRRYNFKLYPNKTQEKTLQRQAALLAALWNAALEQRETQWRMECERKPKGERKGLGKWDQATELKFIRADDPEYAAMSSDTMSLCVVALDDAFKAFFKRAKGGAGASSGYPKYKSVYAIENKNADCTIWHRDAPKGWRLYQNGKHYKIYAKGIPGLIKMRGEFPVALDQVDIRDMRITRVSGVWFASIVVRMEARRVVDAAAPSATMIMNLIDEFARIENRANGECLSGWDAGFSPADERNATDIQGDETTSDAAPGEFGASGRGRAWLSSRQLDAEALEVGASGRSWANTTTATPDAEALEVGSNRQVETVDAMRSTMDTRRKKFSYRWKQDMRRIAKRMAREARQRKHNLHVATTKLINEVSELEVICPPIRENTQTGRGTAKNHGGAVKTIAALNRHVLAQSPAMAIAMLEYKAREAGVKFVRTEPRTTALSVGKDLKAATREGRKATRKTKKKEETE